MEYITAAAAAEKWGVSVRMARQFLIAGRVAGAMKLDNGWLVPADAKKPEDLRLERKRLSEQPAHRGILPLDEYYFEPGSVEAVLAALPPEEDERLYRHELLAAQLHNKEARAALGAIELAPGSPWSAALLLQRALSALYTGDLKRWRETGELLSLRSDKPAELIKAHLASLLMLPQVVPEWLMNADFSDILPRDLPFAWLVYLEYLNAAGNAERLVGAAEVLCALLRPCPLITAVYMRLFAAVGRQKLGDTRLAASYVREAAGLAFPDGILAPFIELRSQLGGMSGALSKQYPKERHKLQTEWIVYSGGWRRIYNEMTTSSVQEILTAREMDVATLAARGDSNKKISEKMGVSEATVKKYLEGVYQKLQVGSRLSLKYILPDSRKKSGK